MSEQTNLRKLSICATQSWQLWLAGFLILNSQFVYGQFSEVELNNMAREAAANRQNAAMATSLPNVGIDFFTLLIKGGVFMIPIGLVSLMVLTFVFDRLIGLRSGKLMPGRLVKSVEHLLRKGELDPRSLFRVCNDFPSPAASVIHAAVMKTGRPNPEMLGAVRETLQREADKAYANVRWLNLSAGIAPLLGLLGTVWGLIRAFHDTTQLTAGQNRADFLAVGIYEALVTTLAGLMVAIPAAVASHYFEGRITKIFGQIEELAGAVVPSLEIYEGRTRFEAIGRDLVARDLNPSQAPNANNAMSTGLTPPSAVPRPILKSDTRARVTKLPE